MACYRINFTLHFGFHLGRVPVNDGWRFCSCRRTIVRKSMIKHMMWLMPPIILIDLRTLAAAQAISLHNALVENNEPVKCGRDRWYHNYIYFCRSEGTQSNPCIRARITTLQGWWLLTVPPGLTQTILRSVHRVYVYDFLRIWKSTTTISPCKINRIVLSQPRGRVFTARYKLNLIYNSRHFFIVTPCMLSSYSIDTPTNALI